jgi:hypothetical protein
MHGAGHVTVEKQGLLTRFRRYRGVVWQGGQAGKDVGKGNVRNRVCNRWNGKGEFVLARPNAAVAQPLLRRT